MNTHEHYMHRCLSLAKLGAGNVAPNPMVGAVLVHNHRIIGEGYHIKYGEAHAEVNCINNVAETDRRLLQQATMYVSLEPCAHYGKTPPCADLIIRNNIPQVVIGCGDSFKEVAGKGIQKIQQAGIHVITGVLQKEAIEINRRFFTFHQQQRPFIILKWAQSADNKIAAANYSRIAISNDKTNRLVHKWRSEEAAIFVGTNTALNDDPSLTTRYWKGQDPVRLVIDTALKLPATLKLFDESVNTIVFNNSREVQGKITFCRITGEQDYLEQVMQRLYELNIQSVLVEGGTRLLQSFIDSDLWDEARVITNDSLQVPGGILAPELTNQGLESTEQIFSDTIRYYKHHLI